VRGAAPGDDRVVALSRDESGGWRASALNIDTGAPVWHAVFPATAPGDVPYGVTAAGGDAAAHANSLNLALLVIAGQLVALDGGTGALAWRHALPQAARLGALSAWDDTIALLLRSAPEPGASPWAPPPTTLVGLDAAGGAPRWSVNASAALPALRAEAGAYAVETLLAAEGVVVYARANRLAGLDPASGAVRWTTQLAVDGSVGAGQAANITDVVYVPPPLGDALTPPRLLATANNWSFLRFILLTVDVANATAPPALGWRSRLPETALAQEWLIRPVADASVNMFYTWANRTDWTTGAEFPPSEVRARAACAALSPCPPPRPPPL
jgi:outer membrane protein assembly factor BamB